MGASEKVNPLILRLDCSGQFGDLAPARLQASASPKKKPPRKEGAPKKIEAQPT